MVKFSTVRIIMVTSHLGDAYGQERVLRATCTGLRDLGHQVYFITDKIGGPVPACDGVLRLDQISQIDSLTPSMTLVACERILADHCEAIKPDVIHLIDIFDFRLIDFFKSIAPVVLTAHTVAPTCPASTRHLIESHSVCENKSGWNCLKTDKAEDCLGTFRGPLRKAHAIQNFLLKKMALKSLSGIAAISHYVARTLENDGFPPNLIQLLPNPVLLPEMEAVLGPIPRKLFLVASRLVGLKGIPTLIDSLAEIRDEEWTTWIYGDGVDRAALEARVRNLSLHDRIVFKGRVSAPHLFGALSHATAFIQPNTGPEGFGLSAVEAASFGVPVVVSNVPAFDEIFTEDKTAIFFQSGNIGDLALALRRILSDGALRGRLRNRGTQLRDRYSLARHLAATLKFYQKCLASPTEEASTRPFPMKAPSEAH